MLFLEFFRLAITLVSLHLLLGEAAWFALLAAVCTAPLNVAVMSQIPKMQKRLMARRDERTTLVTEAIQSMQTLKLHAWELEFESRIKQKRDAELSSLLRISICFTFLGTLIPATPLLIQLAGFLAYAPAPRQLDPSARPPARVPRPTCDAHERAVLGGCVRRYTRLLGHPLSAATGFTALGLMGLLTGEPTGLSPPPSPPPGLSAHRPRGRNCNHGYH